MQFFCLLAFNGVRISYLEILVLVLVIFDVLPMMILLTLVAIPITQSYFKAI